MNIMQISKIAQSKGLATAVNQGLVQFTVVTFDAKGKSTVTPKSEWLTLDKAIDFIASK